MLVRVIGAHGGVAPGCKTTSFLIDGKLLIDAGSVASGLLVDEQIKIDNILISHPHLDHISDLAYLSDNCFGLKERPFEVYSNELVKKAIKEHLMNDILWPDFSKIPSIEGPTIRFHSLIPGNMYSIGGYKVKAVPVNHFCHSLGFIIESKKKTVIFSQDTGPTELIWEEAKKCNNLGAIFTEVSFPNNLQDVADISKHHTPNTISDEIKKMPEDIPIFIGHLKPNYQNQIIQELNELAESERITILSSDNANYIF